MRATFDEQDWAYLRSSDKKALLKMRKTLHFEPVANLPGVGQKSIDALVEKDLAVEGPPSIHGRTFKLTPKGWLAVEWISGRRMREYPVPSED